MLLAILARSSDHTYTPAALYSYTHTLRIDRLPQVRFIFCFVQSALRDDSVFDDIYTPILHIFTLRRLYIYTYVRCELLLSICCAFASLKRRLVNTQQTTDQTSQIVRKHTAPLTLIFSRDRTILKCIVCRMYGLFTV